MKYTLTKLLYVWYKYLVRQVHIGDWSSGMIGVSKTFGGGSIPSSPGKKSLKQFCFRLFLLLFLILNKRIKIPMGRDLVRRFSKNAFIKSAV